MIFHSSILCSVLVIFGASKLSGDGQLSYTAQAEPGSPTAQAVLAQDIQASRSADFVVAGKRDKVPGSVHVFKKKDLEKAQESDLHRLLYRVPGISIQEEEGFGKRPNIGIRGTGVERSQKITLMEDGILAAPAPYSASAAYYSPQIARMDGLEVLKGSSQIKHGPHTNGGSVNMVSAAIPQGGPLKARLSGEMGSFGSHKMRADFGGTQGAVAWLAQVTRFGSDGFKQADFAGSTGYQVEDVLLKLRGTSDSGDAWTELKLGQSKELSHETYLGLSRDDYAKTPYRRYTASQADAINVQQDQAVLRAGVKGPWGLSLEGAAYHQNVHRDWYKLDSVSANGGGSYQSITNVLNDPASYQVQYDVLRGVSHTSASHALRMRHNNRTYFSRGGQGVLTATQDPEGDWKNSIEVGLRYHEDAEDRFQWDDDYALQSGRMVMTRSGVPGSQTNAIVGARAIATHVQDTFEWNGLTFIPGFRYEDIIFTQTNYLLPAADADYGRAKSHPTVEKDYSVFLPGAGLTWRFAEGLSALAGVHRGFSPGGFTTVKDTGNELSTNYEAGLRAKRASFEGELLGFYNDYENLLGKDSLATGGAGTTALFNGGRARIQGVELSLAYDPAKELGFGFGTPLSLAYTWTDAVFMSSFSTTFVDWAPAVLAGDKVPFVPESQASLGAGYEQGPFSLSLALRSVGDVRTKPGSGGIKPADLVPAHAVTDVNASWAWSPSARIFVGLKNASDAVYLASTRPAGLRPGMPRTLSAGLSLYY